jgi:hypothetical protein
MVVLHHDDFHFNLVEELIKVKVFVKWDFLEGKARINY